MDAVERGPGTALTPVPARARGSSNAARSSAEIRTEPPAGFRTRGHERAAAAVRSMIRGRVPHAILISGPAGIGKTTLALDLAAGLLCDAPDPAARPCRACRGCRLVERGRHPDVHRLAPSGAGDQIRIGARDRAEDGTVRRLATDLVLLPVEGGARVAIIERADRLTDDAQTALLKTLEEPPDGVTLVLCADDEDRLLPTVRSRCARIRLGPVATRSVEAILDEGGLADAPLAARLARIVNGRPGTARVLARSPDALRTRDEISRTLLDLLTAPVAQRLAAVRELTARATDLARALDRAQEAEAALTSGQPGAGDGTVAAGRGKGRAKRSAPASGTGGSASGSNGLDETVEGEDGSEEEDVVARGSAPAAERRRAAILIVGLWRELSRDLLVVGLGEERQVRDTALLDDLRAAADGDPRAIAAAAGAQLQRLDAAGELLEANVRPEIVLDTLVLRWGRAR
jgi:DNA polymerase III delta' subunit